MEGRCQLTVLAGKDASPSRNSSRVDMVCSLVWGTKVMKETAESWDLPSIANLELVGSTRFRFKLASETLGSFGQIAYVDF